MLRSKISKAKKGAACVLPGFTVLVLDIKSRNPSMTHAMARAAASRKWKMLSNAEKQAFLSEAGLKTKVLVDQKTRRDMLIKCVDEFCSIENQKWDSDDHHQPLAFDFLMIIVINRFFMC